MTGPLPEAAFEHVRDHAWLLANDLLVAEGRHVATRLIQSHRFQSVGLMVTPTAQAAMADAIDRVEPGRRPPVFVRTQAELDAITGFRLHQGCVALGERPVIPTELALATGGPIVALERVRDPDNVGSIIRTTAALGGAGVLLGPGCADPFYRKAVRTSMGSVFTLPLAVAPALPDALHRLKALGRVIVALTPDGRDVLASARTAAGGRPVVLLLGSEGEGLTPDARALADFEANIPMASMADSLNVAVAAAVALYAWRTD